LLRDKNLIPLSRQHQHALALCVRIDRAQPIAASDSEAWQAEITREFQGEIGIHFAAEENFLFPVASNFSDLVSLVIELTSEHDWLRREFSRAEEGSMSADDLPHFARKLAQHIRKEERMLFERLQSLLTPKEMAALGVSLDQALREASQACVLPRQATRIQAAKDRTEA
jgi:iron-sulfur cluster repair protein YtfE (RIC family)